MQAYIIRRVLLMIPTLLGISILVFTLTQTLPGGPVEQYITKVQASLGASGSSSTHRITPEEYENIKKIYGYDKPAVSRYFHWISNALLFDFGYSYAYQEPVIDVIAERIPISLFFGLTSFLISYLVCIPLGLKKARENQSKFDTISSGIIFSGYVIPGYVLGMLLIVFLAGGSWLNIFPTDSVVSDEWEFLPWYAQVADFLHHMILPMTCYMASEFAFLTLLMKNSLLDEISKDYLRTAVVKGAAFPTAVWKHALRNALIPIATRMSEIFTLMFAGALLIEKVFNIDGMGLLMYTAVYDRDYNVVMAIIFIVSTLALFGRLFSDLLYVWIDPRIRYE
ncbi:MAG: ABC transporter permease subunit [Leptospiraceae bacterium]|nr:ABC transporter permease subunit [Leptospiraceae bacterium]